MKFPQISGKELVKKLMKHGFVIVRQRGSHIRVQKITKDRLIKITVPNHSSIKKGTLNQIIKSTGLTKEEIFS